jgi:hypothetical protein
MAREPQTVPLDVIERDNNNSTSPTANQTGLTYATPKQGAKPKPAVKGGDIAPKTAEWSPFNRKPGDKKGLIN